MITNPEDDFFNIKFLNYVCNMVQVRIYLCNNIEKLCLKKKPFFSNGSAASSRSVEVFNLEQKKIIHSLYKNI